MKNKTMYVLLLSLVLCVLSLSAIYLLVYSKKEVALSNASLSYEVKSNDSLILSQIQPIDINNDNKDFAKSFDERRRDNISSEKVNPTDKTSTQQVLQVDKRFTYALALLNDKFLNLNSNPNLNSNYNPNDMVRFVNCSSKYCLLYKNKILYTIEDKDFFSLYKALVFTANYLLSLPQTPTNKTDFSNFDNLPLNPYELIQIAKVANKTADKNNLSLKKLIESLLLLDFLSDDSLDEMSVLQSNTWMLVAVYEAKTKLQNDSFIAMLANNLQYARLAKHISARLPADNPISQYYQNDDVYDNSDYQIQGSSKNDSENLGDGEEKNKEKIISNKSQLSNLITLRKQIENGHYAEWLAQINNISKANDSDLLRMVEKNKQNEPNNKVTDNVNKIDGIAKLVETNQPQIAVSYLLNQLTILDLDKIRSKLIFLYPLIIISEYNHDSEDIRDQIFFNGKLNTQIENIVLLSDLLAKQIDYPPNLLIKNFSNQIAEEQLLAEPNLLDRNIFINYWHAKLFNSYYNIANYLLNVEKDGGLSENLLNVFKDNSQNEIGWFLYNWYDGVLNAKNDRYALKQFEKIYNRKTIIIDDNKSSDLYSKSGNESSPYVKSMNIASLAKSKLSNLFLLVDLYDNAYNQYPSLDDKQSEAFQKIVSQLDTRYSNRTLYYRLKSQYNPSVVDNDIDLNKYNVIVNSDLITSLYHIKNKEKIIQAYHSTNNQNNRMYLLRVMSKLKILTNDYLADFDVIYQKSPNSFTVLSQYIDTLLQENNKSQIEKAKYVLENWLYQPRDLSHYQYINLITLLAKTRLASGDSKGALSVILPTLKYNYEDALLITISIALDDKDKDKAIKLIAEYRQKYGETLNILEKEIEYSFLINNKSLAYDVIKYWKFRLTDGQLIEHVYPIIEKMLTPSEQQEFSSLLRTR